VTRRWEFGRLGLLLAGGRQVEGSTKTLSAQGKVLAAAPGHGQGASAAARMQHAYGERRGEEIQGRRRLRINSEH
jgi:hypothetical protein